MKAEDIMTVGAATVSPGDSIADAASIMLERRISGLPVVDSQRMPVGIVTERDLLRRTEIGTEKKRPRWLDMWIGTGELAEDYVRAHGRTIADVMSRDVVSVDTHTPLNEVVTLMERKGFKRLPVLRNGQMAGIISRADVLLALSQRLIETESAAGNDLTVRQHILDKITEKGWAPSAILQVHVSDGVVDMSGTVLDDRVRQAIAVVAQTAPGVTKVKNNLTVLPFGAVWT